MKWAILIIPILCFGCGSSEKTTLEGQVFEEISELPIADASLAISGSKGTSIDLTTDNNGAFAVDLNKNEVYVIECSKSRFLSTAVEVAKSELDKGRLDIWLAPFVNRDYLPNFYFEPFSDSQFHSEYGEEIFADLATLSSKVLLVGYRSANEPDSLALERARFIKEEFVKHGMDPEMMTVVARPEKYPEPRNHQFETKGYELIPGEERILSDSTLHHLARINPDAADKFRRQVQIERVDID